MMWLTLSSIMERAGRKGRPPAKIAALGGQAKSAKEFLRYYCLLEIGLACAERA
jgi:hypothetical protein